MIKAFGRVNIECVVNKNKYLSEFVVINNVELKCHIEPLLGLSDCLRLGNKKKRTRKVVVENKCQSKEPFN